MTQHTKCANARLSFNAGALKRKPLIIILTVSEVSLQRTDQHLNHEGGGVTRRPFAISHGVTHGTIVPTRQLPPTPPPPPPWRGAPQGSLTIVKLYVTTKQLVYTTC
jgi:hypothetical protein